MWGGWSSIEKLQWTDLNPYSLPYCAAQSREELGMKEWSCLGKTGVGEDINFFFFWSSFLTIPLLIVNKLIDLLQAESVLLIMAIGKWSPSFYLDPQAFPCHFPPPHPPSCWGGRVGEWLGGNLGVTKGQPTIVFKKKLVVYLCHWIMLIFLLHLE